jgi:hypothetical protein
VKTQQSFPPKSVPNPNGCILPFSYEEKGNLQEYVLLLFIETVVANFWYLLYILSKYFGDFAWS